MTELASMRMSASALALCAALALTACESAPHAEEAVSAYYAGDFARARELLREPAAKTTDDVILDNERLGLAALADGDAQEAERALGRAFELLSTAGLNADRTTAAVILHEGVRIWKGEPFEQALAYYWVAALYATEGDWENARAAAANSIFRLTDFGRDEASGSLRTPARDDGAASVTAHDEPEYTAVETDFALGFLMRGLAAELSGASGADEAFASAIEIDPDLEPLIETLRSRAFDTLLLVDYGRGPTKIAYGPDGSLVKFASREPHAGPLVIAIDGVEVERAKAVCDVDRMANDLRWKNLEDARRAKSAVGDGLMIGGMVVTGTSGGDGDQAWIGLGLLLAGLYAKATSHADTRHLELAPRSIFIVPLDLGSPREVVVSIDGSSARLVLPALEPGEPGRPRAVYLRLLPTARRAKSW